MGSGGTLQCAECGSAFPHTDHVPDPNWPTADDFQWLRDVRDSLRSEGGPARRLTAFLHAAETANDLLAERCAARRSEP